MPLNPQHASLWAVLEPAPAGEAPEVAALFQRLYEACSYAQGRGLPEAAVVRVCLAELQDGKDRLLAPTHARCS